MRTSFTILLAALVGATVASGIEPAAADRGHMVIQAPRPNVSVNNEGQKAIIGWNGKEEVLILATDLSAGANAKVLEFLPLPSKPSKVEKADFAAFRAVEKIIRQHTPRAPQTFGHKGGRGVPSAAAPPPVEIVFHKQIEAHDITIAKTDNLEAFLSWARDFVKKQGGKFPDKGQDRLRSVVGDYLKRGYKYFVFDVIDLTEKAKTVPPILYRFRTDHLFFPLVVSSLDAGRTEISLFLLTPYRPDVWGTATGFCAGYYRYPDAPIKFRLPLKDAGRISGALSDLFKGRQTVQFTAAKYKGPVSGLKRDFVLRATRAASIVR